MISITTIDFDIDGKVLIDEDADSSLLGNTRRLTRRATLDGGCSIVDQGFSDGDRTLSVVRDGIDEDEFNILWAIFKVYSLVHVSISDGYYTAAIESLKIDKGKMTASILIKEKLS